MSAAYMHTECVTSRVNTRHTYLKSLNPPGAPCITYCTYCYYMGAYTAGNIVTDDLIYIFHARRRRCNVDCRYDE